jgi:eukaryotic-like serine/threonine-protein kinase
MGKMTPDRWQKLQELFAQALEQAPAQRVLWLEQLDVDASLRSELSAMLMADVALADQVTPMAAGVLAEQASHEANIGQQFGNYRVLSFIGAGGMGQVYRAERTDGVVRQDVAIKLLSGFGSSEAVLRRFDTERRILARLQHPGIARFLDAGNAAEPGRSAQPYVAMELVDGVPINEYCASMHLDVAQRVKLFLRVLDAVAYAHTQLIVHRDLKPGNVLVDRAGNPRLLDFGIAKPLADLDGELTAGERTSTHLRSFSARYAAPEQVRGDATGVACDIYALGGLLYELLSGSHALALDGLSWAQALPVVEHEVPKPPSTRTAPLAVPLPYALKSLRGDLDRIVLHALKKLPEERYASVEAMRADLSRYLLGEPISLRSTIASYRLRKFVSRYKLPVFLASSLVIGSLSTSVVLWHQQRALTEQRDRAIAEQERAEGVTNLLLSAFKAADPSQNRGNEVKAREVLDQAANQVHDSQVSVGTRTAITVALGEIYQSLGLAEQAKQLLIEKPDLQEAPKAVQASFWQLRAQLERDADDPNFAHSMERAGQLVVGAPPYVATSIKQRQFEITQLAERGSVVDAIQKARDLDRAIVEHFGAAHPAALQSALFLLGKMGAVERDEEVLEVIASRLGKKDLDSLSPDHLALLDIRTMLHLDVGRLDQAQADAEQYARSMARLYGAEHRAYVRALYLLSMVAKGKKNFDTAASLEAKMAKILEHYEGKNSSTLAMLYNNYADTQAQRGHKQEAVALLEEALRIAKTHWPPDHRNLVSFRHSYAVALFQIGRDQDALNELVIVLPVYDKQFGSEASAIVASAHLLKVQILMRLGRDSEAKTECQFAGIRLKGQAKSELFREANLSFKQICTA